VGDIGAPWVFTRVFLTYFGYVYQQGPQLAGTGNGTSYSMALSADGNVAVVGTPDDSNSTGAAWLFIRSGNTWTLLQKLVGSGGNAAGQGRSVALSADGSTAIVGATTSPSAWIFVRTQTMFGYIWAQQGQRLVGSGGGAGTGPGAFQTLSVGLSADGNTAILGNGSNIGEAWVFTRSGTTWTEQQRLLVSGAITTGATTHVALSADGNTAIVGGPVDVYGNDAAWVFTRSGGAWAQQQELVGAGAFFAGVSVALSADGNTAIVGRRGDSAGAGEARVFTRSGSTWTKQQILVGTEAIINRHLGASVALSADGNIAIAGATEDNGGTKNAWAFVQTPTVVAVNPNGFLLGIAGEHVTIKGTGFTGATAVTFGGAAAGNLVVVDPNTIKVTTPPHAPGTVDVAVTNSIGTGIGPGLYTYLKIIPVLP